MSRIFIFADESGDFNFSRHGRATKYFVVCTIKLDSCEIGHSLLDLRREMAWNKMPLGNYFHATEDKQAVRDEVFNLISKFDFHVQATIMEKSKAQPQVRSSDERFYQYGWFYHFTHGIPNLIEEKNQLLITAASIGTKKKQRSFTSAVNDVVQQTIPRNQWATLFIPCGTDPCLQIADYCTWAIQRKWERNDEQSYNLIKDRITYEYDLWEHGRKHYY